MKKNAFTLAEIMIVLMVIGILTAILLPSARNAMPNQDVMKFKKAHNALQTAIRELVNSDKYYLDGDLGVKPDGTLIDGTHDGDNTYFCESISDILSVKENNCETWASKMGNSHGGRPQLNLSLQPDGTIAQTLEEAQADADTACNNIAAKFENDNTYDKYALITDDGIAIFETFVANTFGISYQANNSLYYNGSEDPLTDPNCINGGRGAQTCAKRMFSSPNQEPTHADKNGFDAMYKIICIDIDGFRRGERPFGYGIRADGKILSGARAQEWFEKSIQEKD